MDEGAQQPWWSSFFRGPWGDLQASGERFELARSEVDFVLDVLALEAGAHVLDVPCGAGRHALELASRGFRVTGVDFNEKSIAAARERARAQSLAARFVAADMKQTGLEERFDAVLCFFGSFGYFDDEDNRAFLEHVESLLAPGGCFLLEVHVVESLLPHFPSARSYWAHDRPGTTRIDERSRWDVRSGRFVTTWTFARERESETFESSVRIYTYRELAELLREAGFGDVRGFETGTRAAFRLGSERLTLVAQKNGA